MDYKGLNNSSIYGTGGGGQQERRECEGQLFQICFFCSVIFCLYARFAGSVPAFFHFLSLDVIATAVLFQLPSLGMIAIPVFLCIFLEGNWERERELEKHRTSYTLKKRNWKNTAFSIMPGKGNWKNTAFSITPGKGNWKNTHFQSHPGKGTGKT